MSRTSIFGLVNLALIIIVFGSYVIVAQTVTTGDWTASTKEAKPDKIHLSFERKTERGGKNQHGSDFAYADLQGLTPDQTRNGKVNFRMVREAGTIECEGSFANGKGSGTYRFTGNKSYADGMKSRGFDFEKSKNDWGDELENRLFSATVLNVTTAFADDLLSANFGKLDVDDLFKASIFKVTPQFMAEMKATGFPDLGMEDLVKARIFKIDADYVRKVREMGFISEDFEGLVKFRIFKVTPDFLSELKREGFENLSPEDVVKFRIFKLDAEFIRAARAEEPNITVEQLVQRRIGVRRR
ncbi:MAG: hypothetical protein H7070_05520 [Saprospiraceae bacterium]|nr:hypothetical protein [Pyrinomonadaceae bacterium]